MQLTRQADYAVRAMQYLAEQPPTGRLTTAEIGAAQHIPVAFLTKIMAQLAAAGLVASTRGARGGVALARPPDTISLLAVIEAIEGPLRLNICLEHAEACPLGCDCQVRAVWQAAQADLVARLGSVTFAALAQPTPAPAVEH